MRNLPRRDCGLDFERMAVEARLVHGDRLESLATGIRNVAAATLERLASLRPANAGLQMQIVRKFQIRSLDEFGFVGLRDTRNVVAVRPLPESQLERRMVHREVGRIAQARVCLVALEITVASRAQIRIAPYQGVRALVV